MTKVSRDDAFIKSESGGDWFQSFLQSYSGTQDILDAINNKRCQTVDGIVKQYREQVGLDIVGDIDDEDNIKNASIKKTSNVVPISPMKLKKIEDLDDALKDHKKEDIIVQLKFDGFKTQAIKSNNKVDLYTRRGEKFTDNVPDVVKQLDDIMKDGSFILGELVWEDRAGKQQISDIQTVVSSSKDKALAKIEEGDGKVIFYVYDLLHENNKNITGQKYIERYNILRGIVGKKGNVKVADNYSWAEKDKAMKDAVSMGGEGLVLKPKDSIYKYAKLGENEPVGDWYKYKKGVKSHTDEVILNKYHKGEDKLIFPAYQYKGKELFEVGNLSGMGKEIEAKIKKDIDAGKNVVVEVSYQEILPSGKFRHMGFGREREDKPEKEVKMSKSSFRPLSARHAEKANIVAIIEKNPELKAAIESFCEQTGGTKGTHSIINFLRNRLGNESVSFTDEDLLKYIETCKMSKKTKNPNKDTVDVGKVGIDQNDHYDDDVADYVTHGTK